MRTVITGGCVAIALIAGGGSVAAESGEPQVGDQTRAWLELQDSGNAALGALRPLPGEVADKVYQRYVESFDNQIPERYERERFVSSGGGS